MKYKILIITLFSLLVIYPKTQNDTSKIVASVGNNQIKFSDYLGRYEDYLIWTGIQDNMQARYAVLNNMINEILFKKYDNNSDIYSNPEYQKEIRASKNSAILAFLKDREVYAKITVTDAELREAFLRSKTRVAVRHLYAKTLKQAENLYHLLKMGVSFKELAKETFTDSTLRNNGGYLGYINWGETDPNFENAAYSLKVGEISKPVKTAEGYSIIKVEDRVQDPLVTEDEYLRMKHKLTRAVRIEKKIPYEAAYIEKVFNKSDVKFNNDALNAVLEDLKKNNNTDFNPELNKTGTKIYKDCVSYDNRIYSQAEIEKKILDEPEYDRNLLTDVHKVKAAVLGLLMQDVLLKIAKEKGYDTTSYVTDTFNKLANNVYLNYKRKEILARIPVSDSEVVDYYNENKGFYTKENEMNVQEIIVGSDSLANLIRQKIEAGENFGKLAEKYSLRTWSAKHGGEMGLSPVSDYGMLKDTLWDSQLGKLVGPIPFDKYYGVFRVIGKQDGKPIDINLVRSQIVKAVQNEKGFQYMKKRLEELSKQTSVKINDNLVKNYNINIAG